MKYTTFKKGGYGTGLITTTGGDVYGRVFLSRDPEGALEAATKHYADLSVTSLSASSFTTGKLDAARVPSFTGDIVKADGGVSIGYSDTGVSSGAYPKVSVDRKGRVTGGGSLVESDLPDISFSKITSGKPSTLAGYGILDALGKNGGTLSGRLTAEVTGDVGESVLTKGFVDTSNLGSASIPLGSLVYKGGVGPFFGFLRANGAAAPKSTYSNLYEKIGNRFEDHTHPGSGKPWQYQRGFNHNRSSSITGWEVGVSLPAIVGYTSGLVTKNRVYLLCGSAGSSFTTVYTAPINSDGTLGTWTTAPSLPGGLYNSQVIVTKNRVYALGASGGSTVAAYTAPINSDGTIGTWTTAPLLPGVLYNSQAIVTKSRVYLLGGGNSAVSTVYTAPIDEDGIIGSWAVGDSLPNPVKHTNAVVTKSRVYLLGGAGITNYGTSIVQTAPIDEDGIIGSWVMGPSLPLTGGSGGLIVTDTRVYLLGLGDGRLKTCSAPISDDGILGDWVIGTDLLSYRYYSATIVTKSRVYLLGGFTGGGSQSSDVYTAPFSGGLNDYSPYYDGTTLDTEPTHFRLPNVPQNSLGLDAWIKA